LFTRRNCQPIGCFVLTHGPHGKAPISTPNGAGVGPVASVAVNRGKC